MAADHRHRDVEDVDVADSAAEAAGVGVAVDDQVGSVLGDRRREPVGAEKRPDLRRLALERLGRRRVMEDDQAQRAGLDLAQPSLEPCDLGAGLGVEAAERGLAEVGDVRADEPADVALGAGDPDLDPADRLGRR